MKKTSLAFALSSALLSLNAFADITVTSTPETATPTVEASGGTIRFDKRINNTGNSNVELRVYDYIVFPDGSIYSNARARTKRLGQGASLIQSDSRISIPSKFKHGNYKYVYAAYDKSNGEITSGSFDFIKQPGDGDILQSCKAILDAGASIGDGSYQIDPDNNPATAPIEVYCDMTTDGGGWTLISKYSGVPASCNYSINDECDIQALVNPVANINAKLSNDTVYALVADRADAQFRAVSSSDDTVVQRTDGGNPFDLVKAGDKFKCRDISANNWYEYTVNLTGNLTNILRVTTSTASNHYVGHNDGVAQCGNSIAYSSSHPETLRNFRQWIDAGYTGAATNPGVFYVR